MLSVIRLDRHRPGPGRGAARVPAPKLPLSGIIKFPLRPHRFTPRSTQPKSLAETCLSKLQLRDTRNREVPRTKSAKNPLGFHAYCTWAPTTLPRIGAVLSSSSPLYLRLRLNCLLQQHQPIHQHLDPSGRIPFQSCAAARSVVTSGMSSLMDKAKGFVAEKIAHIPKPEASLDSLSFKGMSRECITVHSNVNVSNPYDHRLPICELTYTLKCVGNVVASGTMPDPGWIAASDTTKLEIPAKIPYDFLISLVKDVGRDWDIDYVLEVGLTIDLPIVGNFTIPLSTSGEMKLPTLKDMF